MTYPFIHLWLFLDQCLSDWQKQAWLVEIAMINHLIAIDPALDQSSDKCRWENVILGFLRGSVASPMEGFPALSGISGLDDMGKNWILVWMWHMWVFPLRHPWITLLATEARSPFHWRLHVTPPCLGLEPRAERHHLIQSRPHQLLALSIFELLYLQTENRSQAGFVFHSQ